MTINQNDFITPITGNVVIQNNSARLVLISNADANFGFEGDESFKLVLRKGSPSGTVVSTSDTITVIDTSNTITYDSLVESADIIGEGDTISFVLSTTNLGPNNTLYYNTVGNATSALFVSGNTGSFLTTGNSYTLEFNTIANIPDNETRFFQLEIREGSLSGPVKITSNVITVVDAQQAFIAAEGGFLTIEDGYKIHTFTSSNNFNVSSLGLQPNRTLEYLVVAGGGGGGVGNPSSFDLAGGGGGAGGFRTGNLSVIPSYLGINSIVVGAGAAALSVINNAGNRGSNSSIFSEIFATGGGGGGVGYNVAGKGGTPGGSGGGRGGDNRWPPAGLGNDPPTIPPQGNPGGEGKEGGNANAAGGGGGAGQTGGDGIVPTWRGGYGGNGLPITWVSPVFGTPGPTPGRWFAGGGGGSAYYIIGVGGIGGGGRGGITTDPATNSISGTVNTGGGGGGGAGTPPPSDFGGAGGSGIVVLRYPYTVKSFFLTNNLDTPDAMIEGSNVTFSLRTINISNNTTLYYTLSGNVTTSDFIGGNTGSFLVANSNATIGISVANNILTGSVTKVFDFEIRENSVSGPIVATANTITIYSRDPDNFIQATGGTIVKNGDYTLHVFTSSDEFNVSSIGPGAFAYADYLIVAGGGGGTSSRGGGGGAGGLLAGNTTLSVTNYLANVGAGGTTATRGSNSSIFNLISIGGGESATTSVSPSDPDPIPRSAGFGGSGGGANEDVSSGTGPRKLGGLGVVGQGFPGGSNTPRNPPWTVACGGGGAGEAGIGSTTPTSTRRGGNGRPISWVPNLYGADGPTPGRWFAGGGGAGSSSGGQPFSSSTAAVGGMGGGGPGGPGSTPGLAGNVNTGGGGGGGGYGFPTGGAGGPGGSGIVIVRYLKP